MSLFKNQDWADKEWLKEQNNMADHKHDSVLGKILTGLFIFLAVVAITVSKAEASGRHDRNYDQPHHQNVKHSVTVTTDDQEDYVITPEMARYLSSQGVTTADLENMSREELEELGVE